MSGEVKREAIPSTTAARCLARVASGGEPLGPFQGLPGELAVRETFADFAIGLLRLTDLSRLLVELGGMEERRVRLLGQRSRKQHLKFFTDQWGGLTLAEIQPDRVAAARDKLARGTYTRGKTKTDDDGNVVTPTAYKRSGGATNRYLATLSHVFSIAMKDLRLIDRNPVRDITKAKEARGRIRFLSADEREALLTACEASGWKPLRTLVLLAISTGARRGELAGLKWADVDLKAGQALVRDTKNGEPRMLPLVGRALEALRLLKLNDSAKSAYVFRHPSGVEPGDTEVEYYCFDAHWYAAIEKAGLEDFRFHDLRHTTASILASQGATLLEIADVLGHKTLAMVKRYSHLTSGHKAKLIERMARESGL